MLVKDNSSLSPESFDFGISIIMWFLFFSRKWKWKTKRNKRRKKNSKQKKEKTEKREKRVSKNTTLQQGTGHTIWYTRTFEFTFLNAFKQLTKTYVNLIYINNIFKIIITFRYGYIIVRVDRGEKIREKVYTYTTYVCHEKTYARITTSLSPTEID